METFTWQSQFGQRWLHLLTRDRKNKGMPTLMAWHCIALRCVASFTWHLHGAVRRLAYRQDITVTGLAGYMAWSGIALWAVLAFNHPL